jgi:hypothetical protein
VDPKGRKHYLGVFEEEQPYLRFITGGAKRYAYEQAPRVTSWYTPNYALGITVSGVSKSKGARHLDLHGGLEAFEAACQEDGSFVFTDSGKTRSIFNDRNTGKVELQGHEVELVKNIVIEDKEYTLSLTPDYCNVLEISAKTMNKVHEHWINCGKR